MAVWQIWLLLAIVLAALVIYVLAKGIRIVQQSEAMVIERLGSYNRTLEPGINIIIPFIDKEAINRVVSVASEREDFSTQQVVNYLLALEYLKTLPDVAKEGDRVFLPLESTQITGALGGIGDLLKGGRT